MESYISPVVLQYDRLIQSVCPEGLRHQVREDFLCLRQVIESDALGWGLLTGGGFAAPVQKRAMAQIMASHGFHSLSERFIQILVDRRRLKYLPQVIDLFDKNYLRGNREPVYLQLAKPLEEQQKDHIQSVLNAQSPAGVYLDIKVKPELLGGNILFWGGRMIDVSVAHVLNRLHP